MSLNLKPGIGERGQRTFNFPLSSRADFGLGTLVVGRIVFDATKFKAVSAVLRAQAQVSDVGLEGTLRLVDVTDGEVELFSQAITLDQPEDILQAVSLNYTSPRTLELRAGLDAPGPYLDTEVLIVWFSQIELTTVF